MITRLLSFILQKYTISGHSMQPLLPEGTTVLASKLPYFFSSPKKGDIIVFQSEGKHILKRVEKMEYEKIYVVGDNKDDSTTFDPITKKEVLGKVLMKMS